MSNEIDEVAYWEALHTEARELDRKHAEDLQAEQIFLLDTAGTTEEYIARRKAMPFLMVGDANARLDQLSADDYRKARMRDRAAAKKPQLRMGEMSYADFKSKREAHK
jgi:hypothetical protein